MSELIGIREASRRLGVSDTAVHKAIKSGRVTVAGRTPESNRPLLAWPAVRDDWQANSDSMKRSHVGPKTAKAKAAAEADPVQPVVALPTSGAGGQSTAPQQSEPDEVPAAAGRGPSYAQSRAIREAYAARLAKLDFETRSGKLIPVDDVKIGWFKLITAAKTRIMGIPAACKSRAADLPLPVVAIIESVCREALEDLANGRD